MEYEIESEVVLFDASTNPSLDRRPVRPVVDRRVQPRSPQRAEVIPEEEDQAA